MLRNIIGGIAVGIANIIPGVSGGTMMVLLGIFNPLTDVLSRLFKRHNPNRLNDIMFLLQVGAGAIIGLVGFANVLSWLFENFPVQTMFWFAGLVGFSIPVFLKEEAKGEKSNWLFVVIGMAIIFLIKFLSPAEQADVNPAIPAATLFLCVKMVFVGMIGGATMLLPGVSGSMVLLILGEYYLFKTMLADVLSFEMNTLILLFFLGVGILLGILLSAKVARYCLARFHNQTVSLLLGLIIASTIVLLIPSPGTVYTFPVVIGSIAAFFIGGAMVQLLNRYI